MIGRGLRGWCGADLGIVWGHARHSHHAIHVRGTFRLGCRIMPRVRIGLVRCGFSRRGRGGMIVHWCGDRCRFLRRRGGCHVHARHRGLGMNGGRRSEERGRAEQQDRLHAASSSWRTVTTRNIPDIMWSSMWQ